MEYFIPPLLIILTTTLIGIVLFSNLFRKRKNDPSRGFRTVVGALIGGTIGIIFITQFSFMQDSPAIEAFIVELAIVLIGGAIGAFLLRNIPLSGVSLGVVAGAVGGFLGATIFMAPLGFCTFEAERTTIDYVFGFILVGLGTILVLWAMIWVADQTSGRKKLASDTRLGAFRGNWMPIFLLLPTFLIITFFIYVPVLDTFRLSTLLARLGAPRSRFICLDNFTRLVDDPAYYRIVAISFIIAAGIVIIGLSLSLLIAVMAYQPIRGARFYRILLVWPYALSPVIAGIVFQLLFNPIAGVINHILEVFFGPGAGVPWLLDPRIAPITVILAGLWNIMGYNILFYIAGLQNVPDDILESAAIDGANGIQRFFRITFPLLSPITFFLIVTNTTYAFFNTFGLIDFMTGGGPVNSTTTMMYNVYKVGIVNKDLGKGAAQSLVLFLIVIGVTLIQFRASRNTVTYGA